MIMTIGNCLVNAGSPGSGTSGNNTTQLYLSQVPPLDYTPDGTEVPL